MRTCIVTREKKPKNELARFVYNVELKSALFDESGKERGRGANISKSLEIFDQAIKSAAFNRAFKAALSNENIAQLRIQFETYLERERLKQGNDKVVVRVKGESIKLKE